MLLSRLPIVCPVCQTVYQVTPPPSRRGERAAPVEARKVVVEPEVEDTPVIESADVISLEDVAAEEVVVEEDEEIVDLGEDAPVIPAADDDATFLEEEEEGEADVSGIVGGGPGEET